MRTCRHTKPINIPGITNTCRAKNRERVAPAMIGPPSISFTITGPAIGTRLAIDAHTKAPVGVLVEAQYLPAESHPQCHEQKEHADDPRKLSRELVSPKQKHLNHVNKDNRHHKIRTPSVQSADEPPECYFMVQNLETAPRLAGRWDVDQSQENPGHQLQEKYG